MSDGSVGGVSQAVWRCARITSHEGREGGRGARDKVLHTPHIRTANDPTPHARARLMMMMMTKE